MKKFIITASAVLLLKAAIALPSSSTFNQFTVGTGTKGGLSLPLVLGKSTLDTTWNQLSISGLPANLDFSKSGKITCNGMTCIYAKDHATDINRYNPLVRPAFVVTKDGGVTWSYNEPVMDLPINVDGVIENVKCFGSRCFAMGMYVTHISDVKEEYSSLIGISDDQGTTWRFLTNVPGMDVVNVTCNGSNCTALGYFPKSNILSSTDNGETWNVVNVSNQPASWKIGVNDSEFIKQNGVMFFTAIAQQDFTSKSALFRSDDNGLTWTLVSSLAGVSGLIGNIACDTKTTCLLTAADFGTWKRELYISHDSGLTWMMVNFPREGRKLVFYDVYYTGSTWLINGYDRNTYRQLFLTGSIDADKWVYNEILTIIPKGKEASLTSIKCVASSCLALISYDKQIQGPSFDTVEQSNDGGWTWQLTTLPTVAMQSTLYANVEQSS